ncbi:hypothetical protein [Pelagibius sp. Alg239-R121]|uniref:hypothetical protein n=1 Tax=Pelagibius sp. Alg239-R121 TaxID=2993448 RepID=UPI0024A68DDB|nr:hypothetical protein [Pelagibius sp. Alg239-R121]
MRSNPSSIFLTRMAFIGLIFTAGSFTPLQAAALWQVLDVAKNDCAPVENALAAASWEALAIPRNGENCAAIAGQLYLHVLRDGKQQQILQEAITQQRRLLEDVRSGVESGRGTNADLLLAEIELKRFQLKEARLATSLGHLTLFFQTALQTDPADFITPSILAESWPENEAAALTAQASTAEEAQQRLRHAWNRYEGAKRQHALLQPMSAFSGDLSDSVLQAFYIGQISLTRVQERIGDAIDQKIAVAEADADLLAAQLQVLEIMKRSSAIK